MLDEHLTQESEYKVGDTEYETLDEALHAALSESKVKDLPENPRVLHAYNLS